MSRLIKASAAAIRPIHRFATPGHVEVDAKPSPEERLLARVAELESTLSELEASLPKELERAQKEGARKALEAQSVAEAEALAVLGTAASEALDEWRARLGSWESLATGIARAVLEQVFTDGSNADMLLVSAVRTRLAKLDTASLVRLRVSSNDFPNHQAVSALAGKVGDVQIHSDPKLSAGTCLIDLQLGEIEVGPGAQWSRVAQLLDEIEREEPGE